MSPRLFRGWVVVLLLGACTKSAPDPALVQLEADGHSLTAQAALLEGRYGDALTAYAELERVKPDDPRLPLGRGKAFLGLYRLDDALEAFEHAVKINERNADAWSRLGLVAFLRSKPERAEVALDRALALNPRDEDAWDTKGDLQVARGQIDAGVISLIQGSTLSSTPSDGVLKAVQVLDGAGRASEALALMASVVDAGERSPLVTFALGERLVSADRFPEALSAFQLAAEHLPEDPSAWEFVGELSKKLGRLDEAQNAFRMSLAVKDSSVVHVSLARICMAKHDEACATAELTAALATATGEDPREALELGMLLADRGQQKQALQVLQPLAEEPEQRGNRQLQLRVIELATAQGERGVVRSACTRLGSDMAPIKACRLVKMP